MKPSVHFTLIVQDFFQKQLVAERNLSSNTVLSYRDTVRLLLRSVSRSVRRSPDRLSLGDFDAARVRAFLDELECERHCSPRTRNQRLAAIKTFFRYAASVAPEHLDRCRQIREISLKRVSHEAITYLEKEEMEAILAGIDLSSKNGVRDRTLLTLPYNTGARVQEIVDLNAASIRFNMPPKVRLVGKGRKTRDCPLWQQTVELLQRNLVSRGLLEDSKEPLFTNVRGQRLSRHGIAYILQRAVRNAKSQPISKLGRTITPHTIRHTTAMQLLCAGVDITVIAAWLGHVDLRTTHHYVEIDLRMKQAAIAQSVAVLPDSIDGGEIDSNLIEWLDTLGKERRYVKYPCMATVAARFNRRYTT